MRLTQRIINTASKLFVGPRKVLVVLGLPWESFPLHFGYDDSTRNLKRVRRADVFVKKKHVPAVLLVMCKYIIILLYKIN